MAKVFRDCVHGQVTLPAICVRIVDTPEFQRLRWLKQLGGVSYVFPNATHTRFEHCIGVSHLAGKLLGNIREKQPELGITPTDVQKLQIAGLVHDIGHGPFSHTYERANPGFDHERHGIEVWRRLAARLGIEDDTVSFVVECLDPDKRPAGSWIHNLLHHPYGALDVDRLDYCKRDARIASMGIDFDMDYIINNWYIRNGRTCFPDRLANSVWGLHRARFELFDTVYTHRVVLMAENALCDMLHKTKVEPDVDGDDVIHSRAMDTYMSTRMFTTNADYTTLKRDIYVHYGAGELNPLDLVEFDPPLSEAWKQAVLPRVFMYKKYEAGTLLTKDTKDIV
jgi:HD superfamily phosphohydrolase